MQVQKIQYLLTIQSKGYYNIYITLSWDLADDILKQEFMTIFLDEVHVSVPSGMEECIVQYLF